MKSNWIFLVRKPYADARGDCGPGIKPLLVAHARRIAPFVDPRGLRIYSSPSKPCKLVSEVLRKTFELEPFTVEPILLCPNGRHNPAALEWMKRAASESSSAMFVTHNPLPHLFANSVLSLAARRHILIRPLEEGDLLAVNPIWPKAFRIDRKGAKADII